MQEYPTITVFGNGGTITAGADTGNVLKYEPSGEADCDYACITRIDVNEWRKAYPDEDPTTQNIDILDVGYWHTADPRGYEPPDEDWRRKCKEISRTQHVICVPGLVGPFALPVFDPSNGPDVHEAYRQQLEKAWGRPVSRQEAKNYAFHQLYSTPIPAGVGRTYQVHRHVVPKLNALLSILAGIGVGLLFLALAAGFAWLVYEFFYLE